MALSVFDMFSVVDSMKPSVTRWRLSLSRAVFKFLKDLQGCSSSGFRAGNKTIDQQCTIDGILFGWLPSSLACMHNYLMLLVLGPMYSLHGVSDSLVQGNFCTWVVRDLQGIMQSYSPGREPNKQANN